MSDSEWRQNMTRSLEKWGPKTDRRLRMVAIPVNNGDVEDALAETAALGAEVERLRAERDGAFTRYDALLWQIANEGCVSARVGEGTRECGLPVCGICRLVHDRDFYRENSAALGDALEIGNAKIEDLRAEVERLEKALRHSARELQYIADDDPCDKCHQSGEGRACVALAERILGPMHTWPDEPNLSAPAEEEGRDA